VENSPELVIEMLALVDAVTIEGLRERINEKVYKMLAKLKKNNKQINESVVNRDDLLGVLREIDGKGLSDEVVSLIQPLVQVNPNHGHIY